MMALTFTEGLAPVMKNEKWRSIDEKGVLFIDYQFDFASNFKKGKASVRKDGKTSIINSK
jgi:hypothetical protein